MTDTNNTQDYINKINKKRNNERTIEREKPFWKQIINLLVLTVIAAAVPISYTLVGQSQDIRQRASETYFYFTETFDGNPTSPQPFTSPNWDIVVNVSDSWGSGSNWSNFSQTQAHHGNDCSPPLATHAVNNIYNSVFNCRDHMMTSIEGQGYSVIYLTPNHKVNFQNGEAVIKWDISSFKASGRQWWDVWIQPYQDNFILPLEDWLPAYSGEPKYALSIKMEGDTFNGFIVNNFEATGIPKTSDGWKSVQQVLEEKGLKPEAARRDTYELRISKNHIKFGIPSMNHYWIDTDINNLVFDNGIVTFGHHEYNSSKDCNPNPPTDCYPTTWHWDNVSITPSHPFTIIRGTERGINSTTGNVINFPQPAPSNSYLRFAAVGTIQLSFDNGASYQPAKKVAQEKDQPEHFDNYWTPIPAGTSSVLVKGGPESFISQWIVRDPAIFSESNQGGAVPTSNPTPTSTIPTASPTLSAATLTPTASQPTPTPLPPTPTRTPTPNQTNGPFTVTFNDVTPVNRVFSGQLPTGKINWGSNQWFVSNPWQALTTKSISFTSSRTQATFSVLTNNILAFIDIFNGGSKDASVTFACAGNTTKTVAIKPKQLFVNYPTGWKTRCSQVTVSSTNGWDTNFDNFQFN